MLAARLPRLSSEYVLDAREKREFKDCTGRRAIGMLLDMKHSFSLTMSGEFALSALEWVYSTGRLDAEQLKWVREANVAAMFALLEPVVKQAGELKCTQDYAKVWYTIIPNN